MKCKLTLEQRISILEKLLFESGYDYETDDEFNDLYVSLEDTDDTNTIGPISDQPVRKNGGTAAEDFENVICDAFNNHGVLPQNYDRISTIIKSCNIPVDNKNPNVSKNELIAQTVFKNIYDSLSNSPYITCGSLHPLLKQGQPTNKWIALGFYDRYNSRPNSTPKTDIIGDASTRISVKKAGTAQLMTGSVCETLATINAIIMQGIEGLDSKLEDLGQQLADLERAKSTNSAKYKQLAKQYDQLTGNRENLRSTFNNVIDSVDDIIAAGGKFKTRLYGKLDAERARYNKFLKDTHRETDDLIDSFGQLEYARKAFEKEILQKILDKSSALHQGILREAATGAVKYGRNNSASANLVLVWNSTGKCRVFSIDEYLAHIQGTHSFDYNYKPSAVRLKSGLNGQFDTDAVLRISVTSNI